MVEQTSNLGFHIAAVALISITVLLLIVKEILRSKRKIRLWAESPRATKHKKKVARLTVLAVALAVSSELILAAIIAAAS
jgi:hypothetical protein